ncbi:hypothetical protein U9M48_005026, partial [Paspalum notatum var. saurae]
MTPCCHCSPRDVLHRPPIRFSSPGVVPSLLTQCQDSERLEELSDLTVVCGGAHHLALRNSTSLPADRTCARVAPTDPDPVWAIEEMPVGRVMGDMVLLPTGDVLIVNGAAHGTAGGPVTVPVLYRPDAELGDRFEALAASAIPRMYHSSAALDTYGRVLVGGSNPHVGYVFANTMYPTELSLEAFLPPYMNPRLDSVRPRLLAAPPEVGYGEATAVRFALPVRAGDDGDTAAEGSAALGEVRVAAVAPAFATHSFGMNQRVVELGVGRVARLDIGVYEAEVAAPPTPGIAPPGYYLWFVVHAGVPSSAAWDDMRQEAPFLLLHSEAQGNASSMVPSVHVASKTTHLQARMEGRAHQTPSPFVVALPLLPTGDHLLLHRGI